MNCLRRKSYLFENWNREKSAENNWRDSQHLEEAGVFHEAESNVAKGRSDNVKQCCLKYHQILVQMVSDQLKLIKNLKLTGNIIRGLQGFA